MNIFDEEEDFVHNSLVWCGTCHCWVDSDEASFVGYKSGPDLLEHPVYICDNCQDMIDMDEDDYYI